MLGAKSRDASGAVPHKSLDRVTIGNGFGFSVFDAGARKVTTFTEAPYASKSATSATRNLMYDAYFGLRAAGGSAWLGETPVDSLRYVDQSGIVQASQQLGPLRASTYVFSPFGLKAPAILLALEVTNTSSIAQPDAAAYALFNLHLGAGAAPDAVSEQITYDATNDAFHETGPSGLTARYLSITPSSHHGASPKNPYGIVKGGGELVDVADSGVINDAVAGFQWSLAGIAAGETRWVGVVITLGNDADAKTWLAKRAPEQLIKDERAEWEAWRKPPPASVSDVERAVWRQSEAILRMAQARTPAPSSGQIVASLPPGPWWITWVRDMSYAIDALARSGHTAEANLGVDFWKGAKVGAYKSYVGHDYGISVVRYFGNGEEESDTNADGPNVEFDGFGLAPWASHAAARKDFDGNAELLRSLIDAPTGLLKADSSIWEVHWNGKQKRFAYTSIAGARGLCDAGDEKSAQSIRDAIVKNDVLPSGGLAQSYDGLTTGKPERDAAVIEAINFGLLNPLGERADKLIADLEKLKVPTGYGYFRNEDGGGYDSQEWLYIDLRVASALLRMGRRHQAAKLISWVTEQAALNFDLIPELYDRDTGDYAGSIPMVGFGAGAYMLTLLDREAIGVTTPPADPCFPPEGPNVTTPDPIDDAGPPPSDAGADAALADARLDPDAPAAESGLPDTAMTDSAPGDTSGSDTGKTGCSCTSAGGEERGAMPWLLFSALGVAIALRRRRTSMLVAAAIPLLGGCASGERGNGGSIDATIDPDAVLIDTSLDGPPSDTATETTPPLDAKVPDVPPPPGTVPLRDCKTSFAMPLGRAGAKVELIGEWDGFVAKTPMGDGLGTGTYKTELTIPAGSWGYKFIVDTTDYRFDPATRYTRYVKGTENSRVDVGDCHQPLLKVVSTNATPDGVVDLELQYVDSVDAKGASPTSVAGSMGKSKVDASAIAFDPKSGRIHLHLTSLARDKYTFVFTAADTAGKSATPLTIPMWVEAEPFDWRDGPLYFAFTDRFRNGNPANDAPVATIDARANYQGGDYAGITAALKEGYFDKLGVRSIWVSPVNENSKTPGLGLGGHMYSGYHGYWPSAPRTVEPHWGSIDDLRALTAEAHKHGIRVIFDLVQNQLHQEHPYYVDHKKDGWFNGDGSCVCGGAGCDWDTHRLDCWFTPYLPDVNWTNMDMVEAMIGDATNWLVDADADGFRVDAVKHMQDIATTTLRIRIKSTLETGNARYWLVGETFVGGDGRPLINQYVGPEALWGQFDFPLYWAIDNAFAQNGGTMGDLDASVLAGERDYVVGSVMSPFLGNHDVTRFLSRAAGQIGADPTSQAWSAPPAAPTTDEPYDRTFLALTFTLTQPGVPLIYYGDEIGMPGTADPDNRRLMRFGGDLSPRELRLLDRVRIVAKARGTMAGLRRGARRTLWVDGDGYVYARGASVDAVLVALNRGATARTVHVALPPELGIADGTVLKDSLGGASVTVTAGAIDVPFTPRGAALFSR